MKHLLITKTDHTTTLTLNRPDVHNAFNEDLMDEIHKAFSDLNHDTDTKIIVLTGSGKSFCAGADLAYMQGAIKKTREQNVKESLKMRAMFDAVNSVSKPVIGLINGAALGGGMGLVAASDIVIAHENAKFGLSEVKLGLAPSVISPFVIQKIGVSQVRRLFVTGERFGVEFAKNIGLVHAIYSDTTRDETLKGFLDHLLANGPHGMAEAKRLIFANLEKSEDDLKHFAAEQIATLRHSDEGQEGMHAFLEKRKANFNQIL